MYVNIILEHFAKNRQALYKWIIIMIDHLSCYVLANTSTYLKNSKTNASDHLNNLEDMFPQFYIYRQMYHIHILSTLYSVTRCKRLNRLLTLCSRYTSLTLSVPCRWRHIKFSNSICFTTINSLSQRITH